MKIGPFRVDRVTPATNGQVGGAMEPSTPGAKDAEIEANLLREYGSTGGQGNFSAQINREYNRALIGRQAYITYDKMRKGDAQIRATLRLAKAPIISGEWYVQAASDDPEHVKHARFLDWCFATMNRPFKQTIWEALLMMDYGFYPFEKVFERGTWRDPEASRGPEMSVIKWKKFAPRHPKTLVRWEFDQNGGVLGMWHQLPNGSPLLPTNTAPGQTIQGLAVLIPIEKLLLFTMDEEAGDPVGFSMLRSAYKHWYYKDNLYKIDAIQKERHGVGIPHIELPPGYTDKDLKAAEELGRNLRANEKGYIITPPNWVVKFEKPEGQMVDVLASAQHHDLMIARNFLEQFLNLGSSSDTSGSNALGDSSTEVFIKATRYMADLVANIFNQYAVRQLIDYNFNVQDQYPQIKVRRIGEATDWRTWSVAMRNLIEAAALTPSPEDEEWLRDQMDLPKPPKAVRERTVDKRVIERPPRGVPTPEPGGQPAPGTPPGEGPGGTTVATVPPANQGPAGGNRSNRVPKPAN